MMAMFALRLIVVSACLSITVLTGCATIPNYVFKESRDLHREGCKALRQARFAEAEVLLTRAYQIRVDNSYLENPGGAALENNLGLAIALQQTRFDKAQEHYEKALTVFDLDSECPHPFQAVLLNNLCEIVTKGKNFSDAVGVCSQALRANVNIELSKGTVDGNPPANIAWSMMNIDTALSALGRSQDFDNIVQEHLAPYEKLTGPINTGKIYCSLSVLSCHEGKLETAQKAHSRALEKMGALHSEVADSMEAIGEVFLLSKQPDKAEDHARQALAIRQSTLGATHPDVGLSFFEVGSALEAKGNNQEALDYYRRASDVWWSAPEATNSRAALSMHALGSVFYKQGNYAQAEIFERLALSFRMKNPEPESPPLVLGHLAAGRALEAQGKFAKAKEDYGKAYSICGRMLKPEDTLVGLSMFALSRMMRVEGRVDEAERMRSSALEILAKDMHTPQPLTEIDLQTIWESTDRQYSIRELQQPEKRTFIAYDPPTQRQHTPADEWYKKKRADFLEIIKSKEGGKEQFKDFINLIDDPFDDLKHEIHGMEMLGYRFYLPKSLMRGSGNPCK